ncbi:MAG: tRNA epoxyqueuosine(34) reductase QueG, partial [Planctomycetota bacterium]
MATPDQLTAEVKALARRAGFDHCGIASAVPSERVETLRQWVDDGMHGEMGWFADRLDEREDVRRYLPGARAVISVALSYHVDLPPTPTGHGRIARYALGADYHKHLKQRLWDVANALRTLTDCETKVCVDTAPVLEREWAQRAGVGWQGKNTLTIHPKLGSYLLLGEIITTADLAPDMPDVDRCGRCTRCLDACPTGAIYEPYKVDARRCISYLTIEHRGDLPDPAAVGDWLFGCDICQEVCPWNKRALPGIDPAIEPKIPASFDPAEVLTWDVDRYRETFRGTAVKRVKLPMFQRNA